MRRHLPVVVLAVLTTGLLGVALRASREQKPLSSDSRLEAAMRLEVAPSGQIRMLIDQGSEKEAGIYYQEISQKGELDWAVSSSTCDKLVQEFLGYPKLGCAALEEVIPDELSKAFPNQIEAVRFFSPKISTIRADATVTELGWRKLVRLRAQTLSKAETAGVTAAFVLFNFLQHPADLTTDPFKTGSQNTQVMLIREKPSTGGYWGYWVMYDPLGDVTSFLQATFENAEVSAQAKPFYVPTACVECHGSSQKSVYLALLDVDNWIERTKKPEEFTAVTQPLPDLVGPLASSSVMDRFRTLNTEISGQNAAAGAPAHVAAASASWVARHPAGTGELAIHQRGFVTASGDLPWSSSPDDVALLRLLSRYCYRCHGAKVYNVFERQAVVRKSKMLASMILSKRMPEDRGRVIPEPDRTTLLGLLKTLK